MKKIYVFMILLLISGCSFINNSECVNKAEEIIEEEPVIEKPIYVDDNPITVGIYQNGDMNLLTRFTSAWHTMTDINVFTVAYTNDPYIGGYYYQDIWQKYYANYSDIEDYKIGYYIGFYLTDGSYRGEVVLSPDEMEDFCPYLYLYLYDDANQARGSWYSHVNSGEVTDDTLFTSIKLFAGEHIEEVVSPITLSAFTYDDEEDFLDGKYRGNSIYTILINNE
ncbi:MAG: hypothetical protein PHD02_02335 [Bacilli bacterium]|nr:hypothetical protein [Bacilli bacterium]